MATKKQENTNFPHVAFRFGLDGSWHKKNIAYKRPSRHIVVIRLHSSKSIELLLGNNRCCGDTLIFIHVKKNNFKANRSALKDIVILLFYFNFTYKKNGNYQIRLDRYYCALTNKTMRRSPFCV